MKSTEICHFEAGSDYLFHPTVGMPCGACREFLMQLSPDSPSIEILADHKTFKTLQLNELVPDWWGAERMRSAL